jgi:hypothetical protein
MSLTVKLRIDKGKPLWLIDAPKDITGVFDGFKIKKTLPDHPLIEQLVFFALSKKQLESKFDEIILKLSDNAVFWIAYPKKTGKIESDLIRDEGWGIVYKSGMQGVSSISINDDWTGMRFKKKDPNASYKRSVPMEERKTEGIDYVNRTVKLPADALKMMKPHKDLKDFFYAMSFSHKREYIESIVESKKPETRLRRIEKMIETVSKLKTDKEKRKK